jgi:hypothetical protein
MDAVLQSQEEATNELIFFGAVSERALWYIDRAVDHRRCPHPIEPDIGEWEPVNGISGLGCRVSAGPVGHSRGDFTGSSSKDLPGPEQHFGCLPYRIHACRRNPRDLPTGETLSKRRWEVRGPYHPALLLRDRSATENARRG